MSDLVSSSLLRVFVAASMLSLTGCGGESASPQTPEPMPADESPAEESPADDSPPAAVAPPSLPSAQPPPERPPANAQQRFAQANNAVATELWAQIRATPGNQVVSPASITMALAMTYGGASGSTATEMASALHFDSFTSQDALHEAAGGLLAVWNAPRTEYEFAVVNRLFGQAGYTFEAPFLALTEDLYRAPIESVDFAGNADGARGRINQWVSQHTNTRIPELLPDGSLDATTRLVLTNAVYFLGRWSTPFPAGATQPRPFVVGDDRPDVPTMQLTASLAYGETPAARVVQLPYQGDEIAMLLVVPRAEDGLPAIEAALSPAVIEEMAGTLAPRRVALSMPKARIAPPSMEMSDALQAMGVRLAFDSDRADFTQMARPLNPEEHLHISSVVHRAFVEIDERGTEAAAATAVVMGTRGAAPRPPLEVRADRPFLFFIRDLESGAILFMGRVVDPR